MQRNQDDTSHGVWCLSTTSDQVIVDMPVSLAGTIRSQGFAPSQRFDLTWTLWSCFIPQPPIGFWSPELFPLDQP